MKKRLKVEKSKLVMLELDTGDNPILFIKTDNFQSLKTQFERLEKIKKENPDHVSILVLPFEAEIVIHKGKVIVDEKGT